MPRRRARLRFGRTTPAPQAAAADRYGRWGSGAGAKASFTTRSTFARVPSTTGMQPAELEPGELDVALRAHRAEAEVGQEVAREDGAVDDEALVRRLALRVAVGEGLERLRALVARLADRRQEERLLDPRRRLETR